MPNIFTRRVLNRFKKQVPELAEAIDNADLKLEPSFTPPFQMLVKSITYQQLSGKAATTILDRFLALLEQFTPRAVLSKSVEELRSVGLSRQKASYIHNVAEAFDRGGSLAKYNKMEALANLSSEEITRLFVSIKGVGVWTAQMYLIFSLGRLDVLASGDLGVRKGVMRMYCLDKMPTANQVEEIAAKWHPLETVGTCLAWRTLALEKAK
ncbi:MAG: DNA-3-methyladenine glycosylase family protein [Candidatus Thorarchaeota archaeon]|nr:MAG: DNA-3-methyladenine glycosylase 2 family protein [Candidatus Thorarchaeota archaeon]